MTHRNASSSFPTYLNQILIFLFFVTPQMNNKRFNNFKDFILSCMHGKSKLQSFLMISKLKRTFLVRCLHWIQTSLIESFSKLWKALENSNSSGFSHNSPNFNSRCQCGLCINILFKKTKQVKKFHLHLA